MLTFLFGGVPGVKTNRLRHISWAPQVPSDLCLPITSTITRLSHLFIPHHFPYQHTKHLHFNQCLLQSFRVSIFAYYRASEFHSVPITELQSFNLCLLQSFRISICAYYRASEFQSVPITELQSFNLCYYRASEFQSVPITELQSLNLCLLQSFRVSISAYYRAS